MPRIAPLAAGDKAVVIFHNPSSVIPPTKPLILDVLAERGIAGSCKNYQAPNGAKIFPDSASVAPYYSYLTDHPERIADDIILALSDPKTRLMIFPVGGRGAVEIVDILERRRLAGVLPKRDDVFFVGFSDTEKLSNFFAENGFGQAVVAPRVTDSSLRETLAALSSDSSQTHEIVAVNSLARCVKNIDGVLISAASQEHRESYCRIEPSASGDILFLESFPESLKESLGFYARNGMLRGVKAIVLSANFPKESLEQLQKEAQEVFDECDLIEVPIFHGLKCGHTNEALKKDEAKALPLRTGSRIIFDEETDSWRIEISNLRDVANVEAVAKEVAERPRAVRRTFEEVPEAYRGAILADGKVFCHSCNTSYGQRAQGARALLDASEGKVGLVVNMPDFSDFDPDAVGMSWIKSLTKEQQDSFLESQIIPAIQMMVMDLKISGYADKISNLTISSRNGFSPRIQEWLADFQSRILPEIPCVMVADASKDHPQEVALREKVAVESAAASGGVPNTSPVVVSGVAVSASTEEATRGGK